MYSLNTKYTEYAEYAECIVLVMFLGELPQIVKSKGDLD